MPIIDIHTHAFPDGLAARAVKSLEARAGDWKAVGNGTIDGLVDSMDVADVDISVMCAIATKPSQVSAIFKWCKKINSERVIAFPSVHPQTKNPGKWLKRFVKAGLQGIKLHPMYQEFAVDDPQMDAVYEAAAGEGVIVQIHSGYDIAFGDDRSAAPDKLARVVDRHPELRMICTHMGAWKDWDGVRKYLLGSNVYLETSFSLQWLGAEEAVKLIREHGIEKVLFGTDWPWEDQAEQVAVMKTLALTEWELDRIFWSNAAGLLGF